MVVHGDLTDKYFKCKDGEEQQPAAAGEENNKSERANGGCIASDG